MAMKLVAVQMLLRLFLKLRRLTVLLVVMLTLFLVVAATLFLADISRDLVQVSSPVYNSDSWIASTELRYVQRPLPSPEIRRRDTVWATGDLERLLPVSASSSIWPPEHTEMSADAVNDRILTQLQFVPRSYNRSNVQMIYIPSGLGDLPAGRSKFIEDRCPVNACSLTANSRYERLAAVRVLRGDAFFEPGYSKPPGQIWVLWLLESPINTPIFSNAENLVNWTATYRPDSTLVTPYEKFVPYEGHKVRDNHVVVGGGGGRASGKWPDPPPLDYPESVDVERTDATAGKERIYRNVNAESLEKSGIFKPLRNNAEGKTALVAWFASNCVAANRRYEFVQQLRQFVPVDVYGDCGQLQCSRSQQTQCNRLLSRKYKFYLSFENSNCEHYVTEKFFRNALWNDVVPIVMGARKSDYTAVAPRHSFIHVDDFPTVQDLANYLLRLNASDQQYNEYFTWKGSGHFIDTRFWCRLCAMVHDDSGHVSWYQDVGRWWRRPGACTHNRWDRPQDVISSWETTVQKI